MLTLVSMETSFESVTPIYHSVASALAVVSEKGEIGRLTRGDAATLAPYLDRGGRVRAQVSAIRGGTKDRPELNVWILVRALDEI